MNYNNYTIKELTKIMKKAANKNHFRVAAEIRDEIKGRTVQAAEIIGNFLLKEMGMDKPMWSNNAEKVKALEEDLKKKYQETKKENRTYITKGAIAYYNKRGVDVSK